MCQFLITLVVCFCLYLTFAEPFLRHEKLDIGSCGEGFPNCANGQCCSQYNFCGTTNEFCGEGCQPNYGYCSLTPSPTQSPETPICGKGYGVCSDGLCCSEFGFCGSESMFCGAGCQRLYGACNISSIVSPAPTQAATEFNPSQWRCESSITNGIESLCVNNENCLPGLVSIIGRGYDITYGMDIDSTTSALKNRIYDFSGPLIEITVASQTFVGPSTSQLLVEDQDITTASDNVLSTYYDSVTAVSTNLMDYFQLPTSTEEDPPVSTSVSTLLKLFGSATGISSQLALSMSTAVTEQTNLYSHTATITKARYTMQSQDTGMLCTTNVWTDLKNLPTTYDANLYSSFIAKYGTHIVTAASIGGYINTNIFYCSVDESSTFDAYVSIMSDFTTQASSQSTTFEGETISRSSSVVCGGNSDIYFGPNGYSPSWSSWSSTVFTKQYADCAVALTLVPIYVLGSSYGLQANLEQATVDYLNTAKSSTDLNTGTYQCSSANHLILTSSKIWWISLVTGLVSWLAF